MPPPAIINPLTGTENGPASWQQTSWQTPNYAQATSYSGASGVRPAAGMDLTSLTSYINSLNRQGQGAANTARIPGAAGLESQSSANIGSELSGNVNPDVVRLLQQQAAERGVATGVGGDSANNNAAYLQALGLTSMGVQEQGQRDLSAAYQRNPGAPLFDPSSQLLTPYQSSQLNLAAQRQNSGDGYGGGAVVPRVIGGGSYQQPTGDQVYNSTAVDSGYVPSLAWQNDPTAAWWQSIGYTGQPTSSSGTPYQGNTEADFWNQFGDINAPPAPVASSVPTDELGFDALYGG